MYQSHSTEPGNPGTIQDSQGILKTDNTTNQDSLGILTTPSLAVPTSKEYSILPAGEIIPYNGIEDYIELTNSTYPVIVRTPAHFYCIDGYNLVEEAIKEGSESILCHVFHVSIESELELALRKTATRTVSEQGYSHYSELVRNCKKLLALLMATTKNPVIHSHGGKRSGINYTPTNKENNIRILLAERLGKSIPDINKYINYGEYLDESCLDILIQSKESRVFFEKAASNKRQLIRDLKFDRKDDAAITEEVSRKMEKWLEEFHEKGKIGPIIYEKKIEKDKRRCLISSPTHFMHRGECISDQEEETQESLQQEMITIFESLCAYLKEGKIENTELTTIIKNGINNALICLNKCETVVMDTSIVMEKEEASWVN